MCEAKQAVWPADGDDASHEGSTNHPGTVSVEVTFRESDGSSPTFPLWGNTRLRHVRTSMSGLRDFCDLPSTRGMTWGSRFCMQVFHMTAF